MGRGLEARLDFARFRPQRLEFFAGANKRVAVAARPRENARQQDVELFGRLGRAIGERAHLLCDDGDASAGLARARRFDAGVQRQQRSLERDLVNQTGDARNVLAGRSNRRQRVRALFGGAGAVSDAGRDRGATGARFDDLGDARRDRLP